MDAAGSRTGTSCAKSEAHRNGYLHPTIHVWILTADKKVLIQQRSFKKDTFPGLWDVSVAGHISAGEDPLSSAVREIEEEVGLQISSNELIFIGTQLAKHLHAEHLIDHELHYIYLLQREIYLKDVTIQKEEVAGIKMMDIDMFKLDISNSPQCYVPHGKVYYDFIFKNITKIVG